MALDFLGKKLNIGDNVVAIIFPKYSILYKCKIIDIIDNQLYVECQGINKLFYKTVFAAESIKYMQTIEKAKNWMTSFSKIADDLFWYALAMDEKDAQRHYIIHLHDLCYYIPDDDIELRTVVENKIRELSKYYKKNFTIETEESQKTEYSTKLVWKILK